MNPLKRERLIVAMREYMESLEGPFPGAAGRSGTTLVRAGMARRLGPHTYFGGNPITDHSPARFMRFELTAAGRKFAAELERESR